MFRILFVAFILSLGNVCSFAADGDYAVNKIPENLLKNAHAVKRMEDMRFEVLDLGRSRFYRRYAITVLDESGDTYATAVVGYDKLTEFKGMEGELYDESGKKLRSLKKREIKDLSASDDNNLTDDNRVKVHSFYHRVYPYTVVYETVVQINFNMFYPTWSPVGGENLSVEQSGMTLVVPAGFPIRYKAFNYSGEPERKTEKNKDFYRWELKDMEAIELEYASPGWSDIMPVVYFGPVEFEYGKYKADISTWQGLGRFIYLLNEGRDVLPPDVKRKVHDLTDGLSSEREKVLKLYDYLQQNTRYISVQLGIGGWQTFDATYVAQKKYGDCKALSNFMYSLLKEAGIRSHYTLIKNGRGQPFFLEDFPSSQFNHIIVCVPLSTDTMWLECTSQTIAPGYIGGSNANRPVLLVDKDDSKLVRTPRYGANENLQVRKAEGVLSEGGELNVKIKTLYTGVQQDYPHAIIHQLSDEKKLEHLKQSIDLPHYDIEKFAYTENKTAVPEIGEQLDIKALNYASVTGKRLFIAPNIITRSSVKLKKEDERKYPIVMSFEYHDKDTTVIEIPAGYTVESMPGEVTVESKFGIYKSAVQVQSNKITYYRDIEKFSGRFPPSDYAELVNFYDEIYKSDRNRIVLVKKD
ncbi:MAG: DUF3857 and transglutaminase domain-containing protein [Chitinophagaceae bacterium]|nr:DUF3857 and transglutaminase domain-containing protein [Chitinophagaceae bacterium]